MIDLVVGGGAVGSLLGWALAAGGREVAIVRRGLDVRARRATLTVVDPDGAARPVAIREVRAPADLDAAPSLIVFAVKQYDLPAAVESCAAWPAAPALTASNGIGAEEHVAAARSAPGIVAASVTASVDRLPDGSVRRLNRGGLALAPFRGAVDGLTIEIAQAIARSGLRVRRLPDARAMKWSKLVANLVGNASSAIVDMAPAAVYGDRAGFRVERRQLQEALAIMRALGLSPVALPGADVRLLAVAVRMPEVASRVLLGRVVGGARGGKDPSLRLHARSGAGPSEVGWLNGAVAREADALGLPAPVNRALAETLEAVIRDPERRAWFRGRPDRLAAAVDGDR